MGLKDKILHYSDKFKEIIEEVDGVKTLETENWGWENYRYESPYFRLAHVERYFLDNLLVLHITTFPTKNYTMPIYGFDVVCNEKTQTMMGAFIDRSPVLWHKPFHNTVWDTNRVLPYWATIFSEDFIALKPTAEEHDRIFQTALSIFQTYMEELLSDEHRTDDDEVIRQIIQKQNEYSTHQSQNKRTFGALKAKVGAERAKYFMENILFPTF